MAEQRFGMAGRGWTHSKAARAEQSADWLGMAWCCEAIQAKFGPAWFGLAQSGVANHSDVIREKNA